MPEDKKAPNQASAEAEASGSSGSDEVTIACCSDEVHIAYRGKADDRLYIVYNRKWSELRYYQANGLKAFCSTCRHRVY